jgi:hypothetical protein
MLSGPDPENGDIRSDTARPVRRGISDNPAGRGYGVPMTQSIDAHADLNRVRRAARECQRTANHMVEFTERLSNVIGPVELAEYANLLARDALALSQRVEAFERLGLGVPSLDATDESR